MGTKTSRTSIEPWVALVLCAAVSAAAVVELLLPGRPAYAGSFAPGWLPLAAAAIAATGVVVRLHDVTRRPRLGGVLSWSGLLLMLWTAGGLPLDLLRLALIGAADALAPYAVEGA